MSERKRTYTLTANFISEADKTTTLAILNHIKHITGESNPVIVNKALRQYLVEVKQWIIL